MAKPSQEHDVIIIGGGPAGMSAGLWCADLGLKAIILEREAECGGQLLRTFNRVGNYIGVEDASGVEIRNRFVKQVDKTPVKRMSSSSVRCVDLAAKTVELGDGTRLLGRAILIATGTRRRKLGLPDEEKFAGRGILDSGVRNRQNVGGKAVVIIGGGDAALENAIILGETAKSVTVVHRRSEFTARPDFIEAAARMPNVTFVPDTVVRSIAGSETVESVVTQKTQTSELSEFPADAILVRIGVVPNTEFLNGQIDLDANGYIKIDENCSTNVDLVFAIGDVASPNSPTIATAVGMGAAAAKNAEIRLKDAGA